MKALDGHPEGSLTWTHDGPGWVVYLGRPPKSANSGMA